MKNFIVFILTFISLFIGIISFALLFSLTVSVGFLFVLILGTQLIIVPAIFWWHKFFYKVLNND